jgi:hypothetical protein
MQEIDPSEVAHIASERDIYEPKIYAIEVDTILAAYYQGILRDPRLVLTAYIIKNST